MAITVTELQTHLEAARSALASSDFSTALTQAWCGLAVLAGLPNSQVGENRVEWRDSLNQLISACERGLNQQTAATAGGIQRTKVTYVAPSD